MSDQKRELTQEQVDKYLDEGGEHCLFCNGIELRTHRIELTADGASQWVRCLTCGAFWHDGYTLDRLAVVDENGKIGDFVEHSPAPDHAAALAKALEAVILNGRTCKHVDKGQAALDEWRKTKGD